MMRENHNATQFFNVQLALQDYMLVSTVCLIALIFSFILTTFIPYLLYSIYTFFQKNINYTLNNC